MEMYTTVKSSMKFSPLVESFHALTLSGDVGGTTLLPGLYIATETVRIQNGDLTLDAGGNENAVWIFQFASDFFTVGGEGGNVILTGDAKAENVFWQTEQLANIGAGTSFKGNILSKMIDEDADGPAAGRWHGKNNGGRQSNMGWPLYGQRL